MSALQPDDKGHIQELLAVLDGQTALLRSRRADLAELSEAMVAADNDRMEAVLRRMDQTGDAQAAQDRRLAAVRQQIAEGLGLQAAQLKLAELAERLPDPLGGALRRRRQQIIEEVQAFRRQHLQTAMLVSQCAQVNRALLEWLFPASCGLTVYGSGGPNHWRRDTGLVDAEL
ncbi:MAG TPA: flagellar export chaperone FlgN [Phycisphaerae bacterium]|nr:flagellar export chaperone FlgN [Phycisphaerae bacterium]HUT59979.1 flagellar export chaperone FlgN [Phycisphaerae bacterium]